MYAGKNEQGKEIFKAVLLTHFILFLHLLIIAGIGILVIFFRGVTQYLVWILIGAILLIGLSGSFIFWRIKSKGKKTLHEMEQSPVFQGRNFEISFLGGLASLKVGTPHDVPQLENRSPTPNPKPQLEDPETIRIRELTRLAQMVEKKLITLEEYNRMKKQIIKTF